MQVLVALNANMAGDRTRQPSTNEQIFDWLTHEHRTLLLSMLTCSPTRTAVIELLRLRVCQDTDRIVGSYMSAIAQTTSSDLLPPLLLLLLFPPLLPSFSSFFLPPSSSPFSPPPPPAVATGPHSTMSTTTGRFSHRLRPQMSAFAVRSRSRSRDALSLHHDDVPSPASSSNLM